VGTPEIFLGGRRESDDLNVTACGEFRFRTEPRLQRGIVGLVVLHPEQRTRCAVVDEEEMAHMTIVDAAPRWKKGSLS